MYEMAISKYDYQSKPAPKLRHMVSFSKSKKAGLWYQFDVSSADFAAVCISTSMGFMPNQNFGVVAA